MKIFDITSDRFRKYGSIVQGYDFSGLLEAMKNIPVSDEVVYVASDENLERLPVFKEFQNGFFGGMPIELGYCMGHNQALNALEYHRGSEVNVAVTDYIVMLGWQQDIREDHTYDTSLVEFFYIPAGTAVEFYGTTLHYCACHVQEEGYCHAPFLQRGTNCALEGTAEVKTAEDALMAAKNKWMLVHEESGLGKTLPVKLVGENWKINESMWKVRR